MCIRDRSRPPWISAGQFRRRDHRVCVLSRPQPRLQGHDLATRSAWRRTHSFVGPPDPAARRATVARRSPSCAEPKSASGHSHRRPKRFSVQRKMAIVARLLRGEPLDLVARQMNVSVARLTEWRDRALAGAAGALKEREHDDRDDEIARLKSKVGEITMDNELLDAKIAALEGKRPLAHRRSRR